MVANTSGDQRLSGSTSINSYLRGSCLESPNCASVPLDLGHSHIFRSPAPGETMRTRILIEGLFYRGATMGIKVGTGLDGALIGWCYFKS